MRDVENAISRPGEINLATDNRLEDSVEGTGRVVVDAPERCRREISHGFGKCAREERGRSSEVPALNINEESRRDNRSCI